MTVKTERETFIVAGVTKTTLSFGCLQTKVLRVCVLQQKSKG